MTYDLPRRLCAEAAGTALLLATVVGSGIMGETLSPGSDAIALLGNTIATGAMLVVLILMFGPISGAHFNPAVTLAFLLKGDITLRDSGAYLAAQLLGALTGVAIAHLMFAQDVMQISSTARTGADQWFAEGIATFGLVMTIIGCVRYREDAVSFAVGLYITAGYWFTASTSFANPAVTIARGFTDTFSGILPADIPMFIVSQVIGAVIATFVMTWVVREA